MLNQKQIEEIREHLENAKNPIFFFDNDPDGLCSFILLHRYIGRGRGIPIKTHGILTKSLFKKVEEFNSDYIFVLDKPAIEKEFIEMAEKKNLTIVHIDHHPPEGSGVNYYNPILISKTNEPVSDICYRISNRKEDLWIAVAGAVSDCFLPDFIKEFEKKYPEMIPSKYKSAFDILYNSDIGKIAQVMSFALRDTISNVVLLIKFLMNVSNPRDMLEENSKNRSFLHRFNHIYEIYNKLLKKIEHNKDKILFFSYSGEIGLNRDLANEMTYRYPSKIIIIAFTAGNKTNVSLRWAEGDIRTPTLNAIKDLEGATGGGHEHAPGAQMPADVFPKFKEKIFEEIEKIKKD